MIHNTNVNGPILTRSRGRGQGPRGYRSRLRAEQAEATRERILEALVRAMANGLASLSVPAVAREAAVSIPTIYRHFGSKAGLLEALGPYLARKAGLLPDPLPSSVEELVAVVPIVYRNLDGLDSTMRAAMDSQLGQEVRVASMSGRREALAEAIRRSAPTLDERDLDRLADLSVALLSSSTFRTLRDRLGLDVDEAADRTAWALRTMLNGALASRPPG